MTEKRDETDEELLKGGTGNIQHGVNFHVIGTDGKTIIHDSMEEKNRKQDKILPTEEE